MTVPQASSTPTRRISLLKVFAGVSAGVVLIAFVALAGPAFWARALAKPRMASEQTVPPAPVALVLGAEVQPDGEPSMFLRTRLEVAQRLFETGKVKAILVSGDNGNLHYNEPVAMKRWLVQHGIPERKVVSDYAGFDTYDSCVRAVRVFGVRQAIVVTQEYHLYRTLAVCRSVGLDAWGVGDTSMRSACYDSWRYGEFREVLANIKAIGDVVRRREPMLGPHETGVDDALKDG